MRVQFKNLFFGPDMNRYRPGKIYEVPNSWEGKLPSGAKVLPPETPLGVPAEPAKPLTRAERQAAAKKAAADKAAAEAEGEEGGTDKAASAGLTI